jgi:gluconolactonase
VFDERVSTVVSGALLERLCTGAIWGEGPVWISEDSSVLWSDIPNNRMLRWSLSDGMSVWRSAAQFTNGHTRDLNGDLLHCSHGHRAIMRTRLQGGKLLPTSIDQVVVSQYLGNKLNSPNDIVVKRDGTIWFTDPPYGILSNREGHKAERKQAGNFVFCYSPEKQALRLASDFLEEPNGLAFSPDEKYLYVSDTSAAFKPDGNHHIVKFNVNSDNSLNSPSVFATISPGLSDGFRIDTKGWLYSSSEDSIQIFHPDGTLLGKILIPEKIGNLTFGGEQKNELFITASTSLYRIILNTRGVQAP